MPPFEPIPLIGIFLEEIAAFRLRCFFFGVSNMQDKILASNSLRRTVQFYLKCFFLFLFVFSVKDVHAEQEKRNLKQFQEYFKDTLLVIYYANPHFETIDFLKELYSPVFKNIVFYGDRTQYVDVGEFDHKYEDGDYGKYRIVYTRNGHYLSRWIKDTLVNYPGYAGYIFLQNDCILQFWNFLNLDKNKIWFGTNVTWHLGFEKQPQPKCMSVNQTTDPEYAGWFNTGAGMPQLKNIFRRLSPLGLDEEKAMLSANFGENGAAWYMVDCFYFPGRFAGKIERLCDLFDRVFCEISIPTMLGAVDYLQNWEEMSFWWTCFNAGDLLRQAHDPKYHWMHPLKFSYQESRDFARRIFNENFYDIVDDMNLSQQ